MRFRRRISIAPGLRLNLSGSGLGLSTGLRGASISVGTKGVWGYTSLPGTGLYQRTKLSGSRSAAPTSAGASLRQREAELLNKFHSCFPRLTAPLTGGPVDLVDGSGLPLAPDVQEAAWKHLRSELLEQLAARCGEISADIKSLATLHHNTPAPTPSLVYSMTPFEQREPMQPALESHHWLWKLLPWHRRRVDSRNDRLNAAFQVEHREWLDARATHDHLEKNRHKRFQLRDERNMAGIEDFLEWHLAGLKWPQDTSVDLTLSADACRLCLDVDFPELEDLPHGIPEVATRTRALRIKPFSVAAKRRLYAAHVHAVVFRLVGEAFYAAPTFQEVVASGYSQRPDKATGAVRDDYLISVTVGRSAWQEIDFSRLEQVDPVDALARFPIRRKMTSTGVFRAIEPFT
ncbi:MAG: DUF4236 domain-containing protein [Luteimonas sp.]